MSCYNRFLSSCFCDRIFFLWQKHLYLAHIFFCDGNFYSDTIFFRNRQVFLWQTLKQKVVTVMEIFFPKNFFLSGGNLFLWFFCVTEITFCLGKFFCHSNLFFLWQKLVVSKTSIFREFYMWFQGGSFCEKWEFPLSWIIKIITLRCTLYNVQYMYIMHSRVCCPLSS